MSIYTKLYEELKTLIYFRDILKHKALKPLIKLLKCIDNENNFKKLKYYSEFISNLFEYNTDLSLFIKDLVISDSNVYIKKYAAHNYISDLENDAVNRDIGILQDLCDLRATEFKRLFKAESLTLPEWKNSKTDLKFVFNEYLTNIDKIGYGIFSKYFVFKMTKSLSPIANPDKIDLNDLTGYRKQRNMLIQNTVALLEGKPASNALLYGDSGTGKSSTIKAIVNKYHSEGLRLIEIDQTHLHKIPELMETLNCEPLKFIIFIDDLSFTKENKDFSSLKAILEGSSIISGNNCVIYATSNRRHLIKENFSDRGANDIHANETIQQLTALSDRFGLKINFGLPNRKTYLDIIDNLVGANNFTINKDVLYQKAESFAITQGNRSPRTAQQFVRQLINGII